MISIIIPTLNEESVLEKTLKNFSDLVHSRQCEIIISDGKSTDRTIEIAKQYTDNIVIYSQKKRQTIAQARNMGAAVATGEYLVFLDADVVIAHAEKFFKTALQLFEKKKNLVGLTVRIAVTPSYATLADKIFFGIVNKIFFVANNIFHKGLASGEFQMIRAEAFHKIGGYNENLTVTEDNEFFTRLSKIGTTYYDSQLTVFHSGRRAHKIGWPRLLYLWVVNGISVFVFRRSVSKEWKPIR